MGKRAKVARAVIAGLIAAVVAAAVICWLRPQHQPTYQGRPLQHWVDRLDAACQAGTNDITAARAIDAAGTNALPFLLQWIHYEFRPWYHALLWLLRPVAPRPILERLERPPRFRLAGGSIRAFGQLGRTATPAIPELGRLANVNDCATLETARRSLEALAEIGTNSIPVLLQIIDNPHSPIRNPAARAIGKFGTNATQAIPLLEKIIKGPDAHLAATAFAALNCITPGTYTNPPTPPR